MQFCRKLVEELAPAASIHILHMLHLSSVDIYGPPPDHVWQRAMVCRHRAPTCPRCETDLALQQMIRVTSTHRAMSAAALCLSTRTIPCTGCGGGAEVHAR